MSAVYLPTVAVVVYILTLPRPAPLLGGFLAGGLTVRVISGVVVVSVLGSTSLFTQSNAILGPPAKVALGVVALMVAVVIATGRDEPLRERRRRRQASREPSEPWADRVLARGSTGVAFAVGMALSLPGASYLVVLRDVSGGHHTTLGGLAIILGWNLVSFALVELSLVGALLRPESTRTTVEGAHGWLSGHARPIGIAVSVLAGIYLIGSVVLGAP